MPNAPGSHGCADADCVGGTHACTTIHPIVGYVVELPLGVINLAVLGVSGSILGKVLIQLILLRSLKCSDATTWTLFTGLGGCIMLSSWIVAQLGRAFTSDQVCMWVVCLRVNVCVCVSS